MTTTEANQVMNSVIKNREKILILEKIVQHLVNNGPVNQEDFRRFRSEALEEVKKDFALN